jgi:hypothetical protein
MVGKQEFELQKELIKLQSIHEKEKHEMKMKELKYQRDSNKLFHERELERSRFKSEEIRKTQARQRGFG